MIWHTTNDSTDCVDAPQHTHRLQMTLSVRALMLKLRARTVSVWQLPHAAAPAAAWDDLAGPRLAFMSCIARLQLHYGMFAVGKLGGRAANSTGRLARCHLTANWAYSHSCPVYVNLPRTASYFHQIRARGKVVLRSRLTTLECGFRARGLPLPSHPARGICRERHAFESRRAPFFGVFLIILLHWVL